MEKETAEKEEKNEFCYEYSGISEEKEDGHLATLPSKPNPRLLTIIQIVACTVVLLTAFVLKTLGGEPYESFRQWYLEHLNRSLVAEEKMEDLKQTVVSIIPEEISPPETGEYGTEEGTDPDVQEQDTVQNVPQSTGEETGNPLFTHALNSESPVMLSVSLSCPVGQTVITSEFEDTVERGGNPHKGLDFSGETGAPIYAALSGTVEVSAQNESYGKYLVLDHGGGIKTLYAHCDQLLIEEGSQVVRGEEIARIGSTGDATGPHLHFELRINGVFCDPEPLLSDFYC